MPADAGVRATWLAALLAAGGLALAATNVAAQTPADVEAAVAVASETVRAVFGPGARITVSAPVLSLVGEASAVTRAVPEPASRTAGPVRFVLYGGAAGGGRRVGRLTARVDVAAAHVRARRQVDARMVLTPEDIELVDGDIGRQPLRALLPLEGASGATTRKALLPGEIVTPVVLAARALVTSGEEVSTVARLGGVEVRGRAIAAQSGALGETVIVVNPDSRRRLRGRVVGQAQVEVLHGD